MRASVRACVRLCVTDFLRRFQNSWEAEIWYTRCTYHIDSGNMIFYDPGVSRNPPRRKTRRQPRRSASNIDYLRYLSY